MPLELPRFQRFSKTATSDVVFRLSDVDKWVAYSDIFIYDQNAYLGDINAQDIVIIKDDIYEIPYPHNLTDIFIKNYGAGLNTRVVVAYLELSETQFNRLKTGGGLALR